MEDAPVAMSGWVVKRGHIRKNWKRRWFELRGTELTYFDNDAQPRKALRAINVKGAKVGFRASVLKGRKNGFYFRTDNNITYYCLVDTHELRIEWTDAIRCAGRDMGRTFGSLSRNAPPKVKQATPPEQKSDSVTSAALPEEEEINVEELSSGETSGSESGDDDSPEVEIMECTDRLDPVDPASGESSEHEHIALLEDDISGLLSEPPPRPDQDDCD